MDTNIELNMWITSLRSNGSTLSDDMIERDVLWPMWIASGATCTISTWTPGEVWQ